MITSRQNPRIQQVRALMGRPRERQQAGAFVIEGVRLAEEAAASGWKPQIVLYSEGASSRGMEAVRRLAASGGDVEQVSTGVMESLTDTGTSQGVLAVFPLPHPDPPAQPDFLLLADEIRDPGNLGTLQRTAAAAGAQAVIVSPGTVDPFSPKVVRAAMGAHFRLP
ncbi:MAG TPA: RNA methyltransferase, partial [Anaerolineaceae bacterium]